MMMKKDPDVTPSNENDDVVIQVIAFSDERRKSDIFWQKLHST